MEKLWLILAVSGICVQCVAAEESPEPSPASEDIKALLRRIEQLEQKVKALESERAIAQSKDATNTNQRIEDMDQKLKALERNRELDQEAAEARAKQGPKIAIGSDGLSVSTADTNFALQIKGVLQVDSRTFFNDGGINGNDGFLLRRARPVLQATFFKDFDFLFVPDFAPPGGPQIFDAFLNYRYSPSLQFEAGKFKSPIGLEQLQADLDIFFNERSLVTDLVPNRDIGFALHGDPLGGVFSYVAGIFTGIGDARNSSNVSFDDGIAYEGRIFFQPFRKMSAPGLQGVGFGVAGSYIKFDGPNTAGLPNTTGGTLPGYATDGQQQFFAYNPASNAVVVATGEHWRLSPQTYYFWGPFGLLGEYIISDQEVSRTVTAPFTSARLEHRAWEVTGSWVLTGESASYKGRVSPRHSFNPAAGDWGALQLVARYAQLNIDNDTFPLYSNPNSSADSAASWSVGLNWYLNKNVEIKASFSHTDFHGGGRSTSSAAPAAVTRQDENVFFTRVQLGF